MKLLRTFSIAIILLLMMSQAASAREQQSRTPDYDAVKDFSITSNPNGVWSYGWTSSLGSPLNLYTVTDTDSIPGMSAWLASGKFWADPPYVAHNDTDKKNCFAHTCVPPTYLDLHPGPNDEMSILRWTAPSEGKFLIQGAFMGLDWGPTTTDVHVLLNSTKSLLSGPITSDKLPLKFQSKLRLSAGDTVDFLVGFGKDGDFDSDSTGVQFKVTRLGAEDSLSEPMSPAASAPEPDLPASEYNALEDWSITSNPNGVWSYGWVAALGDPLTLYTVADICGTEGVTWWAIACYVAPAIAHNDTNERKCYGSWCLPPTYLLMNSGPNGEANILRWTAPSTGMFLIEGEFTGIDYGYPTTTDVHVLLNSTKSLLSAPITSYRLPLTFQMKVWFLSGDTLDFVVRFGYNSNFFGDCTGVRFAVKRLGP
jgi:hypothetical protein